MVSFGGAAAVAGGLLYGLIGLREKFSDPDGTEGEGTYFAQTLLGIGGGMLALGGTLMIHGSEKRRPTLAPQVIVGAGAASCTWSF